MSKRKTRRKFSDEQKRASVNEYLEGKRSASEIANDLGIAVGQLYRWKAQLEEKDRSGRIEELTEDGATRAMATKLQQQEEEIEAYQKKVAELTLINDLLKKLQTSKPSRQESELSGLIDTMKKSARKRKPAK